MAHLLLCLLLLLVSSFDVESISISKHKHLHEAKAAIRKPQHQQIVLVTEVDRPVTTRGYESRNINRNSKTVSKYSDRVLQVSAATARNTLTNATYETKSDIPPLNSSDPNQKNTVLEMTHAHTRTSYIFHGNIPIENSTVTNTSELFQNLTMFVTDSSSNVTRLYKNGTSMNSSISRSNSTATNSTSSNSSGHNHGHLRETDSNVAVQNNMALSEVNGNDMLRAKHIEKKSYDKPMLLSKKSLKSSYKRDRATKHTKLNSTIHNGIGDTSSASNDISTTPSNCFTESDTVHYCPGTCCTPANYTTCCPKGIPKCADGRCCTNGVCYRKEAAVSPAVSFDEDEPTPSMASYIEDITDLYDADDEGIDYM